MPALESCLLLAAFGQLCIAILNLSLIRIMRWEDDLARMPLLVREVFRVHAFFISVTLAIFAVLTWRFAGEMSAHLMGRWLAGSIGIFWGIRTVAQVVTYSSSHWRGDALRTAIHVILLGVYGGFALVYFAAAAGGLRGG